MKGSHTHDPPGETVGIQNRIAATSSGQSTPVPSMVNWQPCAAKACRMSFSTQLQDMAGINDGKFSRQIKQGATGETEKYIR